MSIGVGGSGHVGLVQAHATSGRGLNVEELADMCLRKLIHIADTTAPAVKEQANMFKEAIRPLLIVYMHQAIKSDRTTLWNKLKATGHKEVADIILEI